MMRNKMSKHLLWVILAMPIMVHMADAAEVRNVEAPVLPMVNMLKAAQELNAADFKNAYSKRIREDKNQSDWEKNVNEAHRNLQKYFGNFKIDDLSFKFETQGNTGSVLLDPVAGREKFGLPIIKEGNDWKLDER